MAVTDTSRFYKGVKIEFEGGIWEVLEYHHSKMAQRSPVVKTKLRNIVTGSVQERNFRSGETFNLPDVERKKMQFLYKDEIGFHFMDSETFEQYAFGENNLGETVRFLKEQEEVNILFYKGKTMGVELPITVDLQVIHTEPGFRGDTATGGSKPAKLETGVIISVPLFIDVGDLIKVDTRSGTYIERMKKK
ncbi:MAG: translation elongation factor P, elongation factor P [Candidatus Dadabacteria bacterium CSP1-2]|jgi:elongation factor P|nr:MAG: translation elongation factor P, elongation factor P [Candidatus Dadabacteria bacterium CSP1-2]OGE24905.1 MAG: elongation factor P [Candidatus Dadabacteria bacterium RBG_19FT_COMBO_40_33]